METKSAGPSFKEESCDAIEVTDRNLELPHSAHICSAPSFAELKPFVDVFCKDAWDKTLFVFDIDQTLLRPRAKEAQGRAIAEHWNAFKAEIPPLSPDQHDRLFNAAVATNEVVLMEPEAPAFLDELKKKGGQVIALTASRSGKVLEHERFEVFRHEQCRRLGLHFTQIWSEDDRELPLAECPGDGPRYYKGAIFCNGLHIGYTKGDVLRLFLDLLEKQGSLPERVVFVDDARRNILAVHDSLAGVEHLCCEYTRYQSDASSVTREDFVRYWKKLWAQVQK